MTAINEEKDATPNPNFLLTNIVNNGIGWVTKNTAILVVHGIGFQLPIETLDQFGRGLIKQYRKAFDDTLQLKHEIVSKPDDDDKTWFDNVLRISKKGSPYYIDIYEYYWANYTEDKTTWSDLNKWLQGVVKGAKTFYTENGQFGKIYKEKSIFFDTRTGAFISWRYRLFLTIISQVFFIFDQFVKLLIWIFSYIPFVGKIAGGIIDSYSKSIAQTLTNLLGDITAYNVVDPKSKFYFIRSQILDGAVKSLQYLLEKVNRKDDTTCKCSLTNTIKKHNEAIEFADKEQKDKLKYELNTILENTELSYPSVIVAAHSLGTQIAYDAINRINLKINQGEICTYHSDGTSVIDNVQSVSQHLQGFVTFGSPLDKVVFFLRENIPGSEYLRQQFLDDFHGFKQRELNSFFNNPITNKEFVKSECGLKKFFEDVTWRNYHDDKDYISGGLDYYTNLTNINCQFKAGTFGFTHSYYWDNEKFFVDVIDNFLN